MLAIYFGLIFMAFAFRTFSRQLDQKRESKSSVVNEEVTVNSEQVPLVDSQVDEEMFVSTCEASTNISISNLDEFEALMASRMRRVAATCSKRKHRRNRYNKFNQFFMVNQLKLLWCPVYKAATSNWNKYLIQLHRSSVSKVIYTCIPSCAPT